MASDQGVPAYSPRSWFGTADGSEPRRTSREQRQTAHYSQPASKRVLSACGGSKRMVCLRIETHDLSLPRMRSTTGYGSHHSEVRVP